jgi:hypothetical protein
MCRARALISSAMKCNVDCFYTPRCIELGDLLMQQIVRIPRKLASPASPDLTVRVLGGCSLLVVAQ